MKTPPQLKPGARIRLDSMGTDPDPIKPGTEGTVTGIMNMGAWVQVQVRWDNGRTLGLSIPEDTFTVLTESPCV